MLIYKYLSKYILDKISLTEWVDIALELIGTGTENENLYILAGLDSKSDIDGIRKYLDFILDEMKISSPSEEDAAAYLLYWYCSDLVNRRMEPEEFLRTVYDELFNYIAGTYTDKDYTPAQEFILFYWQLDDLENELVHLSPTAGREDEKKKLFKRCAELALMYVNENENTEQIFLRNGKEKK
ncbi:hypothetical protein [Breznakiella homolactica]|uniref:Uncharacterized protein n=1 Tax=Breznakiella homolactica TaxID=2798577 RepID=A0A7T8BBI3_9SPIR|nr:hypothetical protein [Breznakiella homolactica]QQO10070.1 hypothetical protein JFL75_03900 [Breznakiella homolactica]